MTSRHVLILGGTGEARRLCERLVGQAGLRVTLSLAGRTAAPLQQASPTRQGGFGGAAGLARYLCDGRVDILVDATHPFATRISKNALQAALETHIPLVVLERPAWDSIEGDRWIEVDNLSEAAQQLGQQPRTVFLTVGRQELGPFAAQPQHRYIVRSVDPVEPCTLANARFIRDRGPFDEAIERSLLLDNGVDVIVSKNSGGDATYAKIAAARALHLPVIMVRRPRPPDPDAVATVEEAVERICHFAELLAKRGE